MSKGGAQAAGCPARLLSRVSPTRRTPSTAIVFTTAISLLLIGWVSLDPRLPHRGRARRDDVAAPAVGVRRRQRRGARAPARPRRPQALPRRGRDPSSVCRDCVWLVVPFSFGRDPQQYQIARRTPGPRRAALGRHVVHARPEAGREGPTGLVTSPPRSCTGATTAIPATAGRHDGRGRRSSRDLDRVGRRDRTVGDRPVPPPSRLTGRRDRPRARHPDRAGAVPSRCTYARRALHSTAAAPPPVRPPGRTPACARRHHDRLGVRRGVVAAVIGVSWWSSSRCTSSPAPPARSRRPRPAREAVGHGRRHRGPRRSGRRLLPGPLVNAAHVIDAAQALGIGPHTQAVGVMTAIGESASWNSTTATPPDTTAAGCSSSATTARGAPYEQRMDPIHRGDNCSTRSS